MAKLSIHGHGTRRKATDRAGGDGGRGPTDGRRTGGSRGRILRETAKTDGRFKLGHHQMRQMVCTHACVLLTVAWESFIDLSSSSRRPGGGRDTLEC